MMQAEAALQAQPAGDHAALSAACEPGVGLCTIVGIEGSFSRKVGAQLAILPDGSTVGSLSDGCLEAQLASDMRTMTAAQVRRYGAGAQAIDFRLPCGGGLDILLDPAPDRAACREAVAKLTARHVARLHLPGTAPIRKRQFQPALRIVAFGEGPELAAIERLAAAMGLECDARDKTALSLGSLAKDCRFDRWTAVVMLFHDHEWEAPLLEQALSSEAFYVGAQGGERARIQRTLSLASRNIEESRIARIRSPIGLIPTCRSPETLALSALAEIVGDYERLYG
ncbi:XdhC family protein [Qipengyuania flava]|nr:XdhC family protein [Qipengyuania flava]MBY5964579.1 XdhC family protein [Qipengyuania flava]MBY6010903.1 XdhC family protein [Qipengyuania flava]MBY6025345.1 XdhC family protein [Qipengyuania flava]